MQLSSGWAAWPHMLPHTSGNFDPAGATMRACMSCLKHSMLYSSLHVILATFVNHAWALSAELPAGMCTCHLYNVGRYDILEALRVLYRDVRSHLFNAMALPILHAKPVPVAQHKFHSTNISCSP